MNPREHLDLSFRPADVSEEEWRLRVELAACYRIFAELGWTELIYNHQTVRIPGAEKHFLINPYGLMYREIRASNLVKIDARGRVIGESAYTANPAGFAIHGAVHGGMADAHCVLHIHTTAAMAVSCMRGGLRFDNFYSAMLWDNVAYHDFGSLIFTEDEGMRLIDDFAGKHTLILRNHGLLAQAKTIPLCFAYLWTLFRACEVQLATDAMGGATIPIPPAACAEAARLTLHWNPPGEGQDLFTAMVRMIDAKDPSYRT